MNRVQLSPRYQMGCIPGLKVLFTALIVLVVRFAFTDRGERMAAGSAFTLLWFIKAKVPRA